MRTEIVNVTPRMAEAWLAKNANNRPLRSSVIETYANAMRRGEWQISPQGITFDVNGNLIDGQHRLNAVVLCGLTVPFVVAKGYPPETFRVLDQGERRRPGDILNVSHAAAAVFKFVAKLDQPDVRGAFTPPMLVPYMDAFEQYFDSLIASSPSSAKTWSSADVRAAAILKIADGESRDYVQMIYSALVLREFEMMPPIVRSLVRQQMDGIARQAANDRFARCVQAFTESKAGQHKLQIKGTEAAVKWARDVIRDVMDGKEKARSLKKKAAPKIVNARHDLTTDVR